MDRLIDEIVKVSVSDAIAAATPTSVNTAAVLGVYTGGDATTQVLYDQDSVETAYGASSGVAKLSKSFFGEADNPGRLVCIPVAAEPTVANIASVLDAALGMGKDSNGRDVDFYNVILRIDTNDAQKVSDIVKMIEGDDSHTGLDDWCKENFRLAHLEFTDRTVAHGVIDGLAKPTTRIAYYFHSESTGKSLAAALVADRCGNDPARGTWAHKTLGSVVADATTKAQLIDAQDKGLNVYVKIAGVERTYMGTTGSNKTFIDEVVKKDWIKFRTQEAIFNLLGQANNGDGVDYNDNGIQAVAAAVTSIFNTAMDNDHRYVLPDSTDVTVPKYADISSEDKAVRNLPDVKATFSIQASIHTVKTVELQVVA